ncbi:MAG: glycosyltransferase [Synergistaceae bacterium]|nr:glycosyltransferase [Synergistaceae bacterium]
MEDTLVSVVVPVWNAEAHIRETLSSIIAQDWQNLEIIIVDDASTDSSREIAQTMLSNSGRTFRVINHPQNLGVSAARNSGLDSAKGRYIWFCDADDLAKSNFASELAGLSEKYHTDLAFCGMINKFEDGRPDSFQNIRVKSAPPADGEEALYQRMLVPIVPSTCCILFRRDLLTRNNIRFQEGCIAFEDIEFEMKAFCHAGRVSFSGECLYIYVHGQEMGSVRENDTPAKKLRRYIDSSEAHLRIAEYLRRNAPSERTKSLAENMLMPEAVVRKFTVCAMSGDKAGFCGLLKDREIRKVLLSSRRVLFRKPEIFMKSMLLLYAPGIYYLFRKGR